MRRKGAGTRIEVAVKQRQGKKVVTGAQRRRDPAWNFLDAGSQSSPDWKPTLSIPRSSRRRYRRSARAVPRVRRSRLPWSARRVDPRTVNALPQSTPKKPLYEVR